MHPCLRQAMHLLLNKLSSAAVSVSGCSFDSTATLWHTSERHLAVISLMSLWYPPCEQLRACSTVCCLPQTQLDVMCGGCQPNRRHRASQKAPLCKLNPNSSRGSRASQFDAPFSLQQSVASVWGTSHVVYLPPLLSLIFAELCFWVAVLFHCSTQWWQVVPPPLSIHGPFLSQTLHPNVIEDRLLQLHSSISKLETSTDSVQFTKISFI